METNIVASTCNALNKLNVVTLDRVKQSTLHDHIIFNTEIIHRQLILITRYIATQGIICETCWRIALSQPHLPLTIP